VNARLNLLQTMPRSQLLEEIRTATGNNAIVLWEMIPYGAMYEPVVAGTVTAQTLGVEEGDVIGYVVTNRPLDALSAYAGSVNQDEPIFADPFTPGSTGSAAAVGIKVTRVK
jgi:hypothetical protein